MRYLKIHRYTLLAFTLAGLAASAHCKSNAPAADVRGTGAATAGASHGMDPCKLLTESQVRTVVPDLAGSMVTSHGESLLKNVEVYQCSHVNTNAEGLHVIVSIAEDDASFSRLEGDESRYESATKLDIGDAAWLYPKEDGLGVTVHKGRTVIDLHLNTKDATQKAAPLTELARAVTAKVG